MKVFLMWLFGIALGGVAVLLAVAGGWLDAVLPAHPTKKGEWGSFPTHPKVELLDDGRELRLLEDFAYLDPAGKVWAAKKNSIVDGASIPQLFWSVTGGPLEGEFRNASIVHDTACVAKTEPWEDVHYMFYEACRCGGLPENKAKIMYAAVYHFGPRWEIKVVQEMVAAKDKAQKKIVTVHIAKALPSAAPKADAREKLEKYINDKKPSLEELRKVDPNRL